MNREETKQAIEVMQAFVDDREIEFNDKVLEWVTHNANESIWNWEDFIYRIKPKAPREFWIVDVTDRSDRYPHVLSPEEKEKHFANYTRYIKVREVID